MEPRISIITLGVSDLPRAIRFCRDGLGFPTPAKNDAPIAFFMTGGTRLARYPLERLAEDVSTGLAISRGAYGGITQAHNVRTKEEVAQVLVRAEKDGGKIVKQAPDVFWGGRRGHFSDPDGYNWEVAWGPMFTFDPSGAVIV